jgi:hypothetical protein
MTRGGITGDSEAELIVVGGGLVGLTLAIACAEGGIRTIVVEAESAEALRSAAYDGRSAAIAYGSQQVLQAIGAWDAIAPDAQPILDIRVTDGGWHVKGEGPAYVHYSHLDLLDRKPTPLPPSEPRRSSSCEPEPAGGALRLHRRESPDPHRAAGGRRNARISPTSRRTSSPHSTSRATRRA